MLYRKIMVICSEIHAKHINTLYGENVGLVNVKTGGMYRRH
jgi:ABC-type enterobactin transport system permease subunit